MSDGDSRPVLFPTGRVEALSDGVIAIVITLLVLGVTEKVKAVVEGFDGGNYPGALRLATTDSLSYAFSFLVVAAYWVQHHEIFHHLRGVSGRTAWLNLVFLLFLSFIPFPSALLGDAHLAHLQAVLVLFSLNLIAAQGALAAFWLAACRGGHLKESATPAEVRAVTAGLRVGFVADAIGLVCSLVGPYPAIVAYAARLPLFLVTRWRGARRPGLAGDEPARRRPAGGA